MMLSMLFEVQEAPSCGIGLATENATIHFTIDSSSSWILHSMADIFGSFPQVG